MLTIIYTHFYLQGSDADDLAVSALDMSLGGDSDDPIVVS